MIDNLVDIQAGIRFGRYRLLGIGSGRKVFDLNDGYVVKVAVNNKGIAQNQVEYEISNAFRTYKSTIIAKVIDISDDDKYLIMEKAEKIKNLSYVVDYYDAKSMEEILAMDEITTLIEQYHVVPIDLWRLCSWGGINGRPVIIDYGYTQEVKLKYYVR